MRHARSCLLTPEQRTWEADSMPAPMVMQVFYESEIGSRMYFIKRGIAQVCSRTARAARVPVQPLSFAGLYSWACACACACSCAQVGKGDTVVSRLHEGEYFGEVALLTDQPRTASVVAVTDLMLLSLSCADLDSVLTAFPAAGARIEAAAKERLKTMARNDGIHMRRGSHGALSSLLGSLRSRSSSLRDTAPRRCTFTRRRSHGRGPASSEMGRAAQTLSSRLDGLEESERRPSLEEAMGDHAFDSSIADPRSRKLTRRGSQQAGYLRPCRGLGLWPRSATEAAHDTPRAEQCATAPVEARRAWDQGKGKSRRISVSNVASSPALADVSQPALATSLGRRRSVDAGLTFNEPRRIALASCASIGPAVDRAPQSAYGRHSTAAGTMPRTRSAGAAFAASLAHGARSPSVRQPRRRDAVTLESANFDGKALRKERRTRTARHHKPTQARQMAESKRSFQELLRAHVV